ncbi:MAG: MFS transporter [Acidobacteriota bacterium]|nr:MFS transporter [Acidobacteriota bacterium]
MSRKRSLAAALLIAAVNLRLTVATVPPVLNQIRHTTGLSSAGAGLLTGVPVLCFGLVALASPRLIRRFSMGPLLSLTMLAVICGAAIRLVPALVPLFLGTVLLGSGIAVGNVLIPSLIKRDFPQRRVLMTALYSVALSGGATLAAGLTVPIEHAGGLGWRVVITLWGAFAVLAVLLWTPHVREEAARGDGIEGAPLPGLWRDPLAWCVSGFMGFQSFGFYATLSWLPTIAEAHGVSASHAGLLLSLASFSGMLAALSTPSIERRLKRPATAVAVCITASAAGYTGLLLAPDGPIELWCVLFGVGQGAPLALALGYIVDRAPDSNHAAHLSTMSQSVGYLIASAAPFAVGALHGATNSWTLPLVLLLVALVPMLLTGLVASQDRYVLAREPA